MVVTRGRSDQRRGGSGSWAQPAIQGTVHRQHLRRGQKISVETLPADTILTVETGCLLCELQLAPGVRHIMLVLFPADVFRPAFAPPLQPVRLHAAMPTTITRAAIGERKSDSAAAAEMPSVDAATARILARSCLYATAMGRLSAEERLGTLLVDLALHLGAAQGTRYSFELPLSRRDMADFLALNPDSLSRLMSRLKSTGLLELPARSRAVARSLNALMATTPLADALMRLKVGPEV